MQVRNLLLLDTPGIKTIISGAWWSKAALFQTLHITHKKGWLWKGHKSETRHDIQLYKVQVCGYLLRAAASKLPPSENQPSLFAQRLNTPFPGGASGKESAVQYRRHRTCEFDPWVMKIPWRRKWQPTPVFLHGKFHGQRSLAGYSPWGCKEAISELSWHLPRIQIHNFGKLSQDCHLCLHMWETPLKALLMIEWNQPELT